MNTTSAKYDTLTHAPALLIPAIVQESRRKCGIPGKLGSLRPEQPAVVFRIGGLGMIEGFLIFPLQQVGTNGLNFNAESIKRTMCETYIHAQSGDFWEWCKPWSKSQALDSGKKVQWNRGRDLEPGELSVERL